ncbi:hypothetical protein RRG08_017684 [Elysia crispata]|uniref:Secreted protein n=1 Tax=Elysia crispata TaxID=231223 RepID=A0AAE1CY58_9GAST|nr:hypothetical protein RRG08_017684 [Elysia crispata]
MSVSRHWFTLLIVFVGSSLRAPDCFVLAQFAVLRGFTPLILKRIKIEGNVCPYTGLFVCSGIKPHPLQLFVCSDLNHTLWSDLTRQVSNQTLLRYDHVRLALSGEK